MLKLASDSICENYQVESRILVSQFVEWGPAVESGPEDVEKGSEKTRLISGEFNANGFFSELKATSIAL